MVSEMMKIEKVVDGLKLSFEVYANDNAVYPGDKMMGLYLNDILIMVSEMSDDKSIETMDKINQILRSM